jgi:UDP-glucose 4-epimerase
MPCVTCLVTGGAGFLGSHLCDALIRKHDRVYAIDNLATGSIDNIRHLLDNSMFHFVNRSVLDEDVTINLIKKCDVIYHFAAAVGVKLVYEQPTNTILNNVKSSQIVLEFASRYRKKILLASSSEVYGNRPKSVPGRLGEDREAHIASGKRWCYAATKVLTEHLARAYHVEKELFVVVCRFFNIVGPRQTGKFGMVLPRFVEWAVNGHPLTVYGDGAQKRSFCSVYDAIDATVKLMDRPDASGHTFNVGSDQSISINELAQKVKHITKSISDIIHVPYEDMYGPGSEDICERTPDISKLKQLVDFKPSDDLDTLIREIAEYYIGQNENSKNKHRKL